MSKEIEYQIKNISRAVLGATWLCEPNKLEEMRSFLEFRASGHKLEEEVVKAAFIPTAGSELFRDDEGKRIDVDGIRYLPLFGVMAPRANLMMNFSGGTSTIQHDKDMRAALNDPMVTTIIQHVDSPGGAASMVPELGELIRKNRNNKKIITVAEGMMASGALWVGTAATEVYASLSTDVGSQGAYRLVATEEKANEEAGIAYHVIRAGEFKAIGNKYEALAADGKAELQRSIDELNHSFVAAMAANRDVSEEFVREQFGRGKLFSAADAKDRKLIDGVIGFEELLDRERTNNSTTTTTVSVGGAFMKVTQRVKAALFANGCIETIEAADEVCVAYLRGCGKSLGVSLEDAEEQQLIDAIQTKPAEATTGIDGKGEEYATVVAEPIRELASEKVEAEQRQRIAEIRLAGAELNIPREVVNAHLTSTMTTQECQDEFLKLAADTDTPLEVVAGDASQDKISKAFTGALLERVGSGIEVTSDERSYARSFYDASFLEMAREVNASNGEKPSGNREKDAKRFLLSGFDGVGQSNGKMMLYGDGQMNEPSYNRRGDHPDALSNLMNRIMDGAYDQAGQTYTTYTKKAPDVPDTRPKTFFETAVFQELDALGEDETMKQLKFTSNMKAMLQVAKYGNKVALTEEMIIEDDLSIFDTQLATLQEGAVNTVDNSCRTMLVSNPTMLDGTSMFELAKGNYIDSGSGSAPSAQSAATMRTMHRLIKGFGSTRVMNQHPTVSFHPAAHEEAAHQTFLFSAFDPKVANTDATVNTVRGQITPVLDGMLDGYANGAFQWWTIVPKYKPLIVAFLRGKGGPTGSRTTWIDPDTGSRYVGIKLWAGYAPLNFRGTVLNFGQ